MHPISATAVKKITSSTNVSLFIIEILSCFYYTLFFQSYIFKELDEQLSELDFRLAQIMNEANLPPKIVEDEDVSSYDSFCGSELIQQNVSV